MEFNPNARPDPAPLDRFWISTGIPLHPEVVTNTAAFRRRTGVPLRQFKPTKSYSQDNEFPSANLFIEDYNALRLFADHRRAEPWSLRKIEANIPILLYGHNGHIIDERELQLGLSLLLDLIPPLLAHPDDYVHLIPGLTPVSQASWTLAEIPFQIFDPDGHIQHAFLNPRHPEIKKAALRCDGESVHLGGPNAEMSIDFYRKDIEMKKVLRRHDAPAPSRIFRIEVRLTGDKLLKYLGRHGNTRVIRGKSRLTNFTGLGLLAAYHDVVTHLQGCYQSSLGDSGAPTDNVMGRLMAHVSRRTGLSIDDQITICRERFRVSDNTVGRYRIAARDEHARLSPFRVEDVFSPENYLNQPGIAVPELERMCKERRERVDIHPLVAAAYGHRAEHSSRPSATWTD